MNLANTYVCQYMKGIIMENDGSLEQATEKIVGLLNQSGSTNAELGNLNNMYRLFLDDNQLSGEIPNELGALSELKWLHLNDNLLVLLRSNIHQVKKFLIYNIWQLKDLGPKLNLSLF